MTEKNQPLDEPTTEQDLKEETLPDSPSEKEFAQRMESPDTQDTSESKEDPAQRIAELEDQVLRMAAEMQNIRTRTKKELEDTRKYAISNFAENLIGVLENLRRAQESATNIELEPKTALENLSQGVALTADELITIFQRHGIERIDPLGQLFNHDLHQALVQMPTNEYEVGTVSQVMAAGYKFKDRLLRPAMVAVAIAAKEDTAEDDQTLPTADSA